MAYKYPICDVFHWFCKIARFFATEPQFLPEFQGINILLFIHYIGVHNCECTRPSHNCEL